MKIGYDCLILECFVEIENRWGQLILRQIEVKDQVDEAGEGFIIEGFRKFMIQIQVFFQKLLNDFRKNAGDWDRFVQDLRIGLDESRSVVEDLVAEGYEGNYWLLNKGVYGVGWIDAIVAQNLSKKRQKLKVYLWEIFRARRFE